MNNCPDCSKIVSASIRFCPYCGHRLAGKRRSSFVKLVLPLGAVVLVFGIVGLMLLQTSQNASHPALTAIPAVPPNAIYHRLGKGETRNVLPYAVVTGDVSVNGHWMADKRAGTGLVLILTHAASVHAPFGAEVLEHLSTVDAHSLALILQRSTKQQGCGMGHGCPYGVSILTWPGARPQGVK